MARYAQRKETERSFMLWIPAADLEEWRHLADLAGLSLRAWVLATCRAAADKTPDKTAPPIENGAGRPPRDA